MSRAHAEALSCMTDGADHNTRRAHSATELVPVSIERRWCTFHEKWEVFGYLRRPSSKGWWPRKMREAFTLFIVAEIIAISTLLLAGGAIAAMR